MGRETLSRRTFIGAAGALAIAGLAGCAGSRGESGSTATAAAAASASSESSASASSSSGASGAAGSSSSTAAASAMGGSGNGSGGGKSLIVLWSWSGNTLAMAERISELSGADIYRIEAADPYPADYDACTDRAKQEQNDGAYPAIANPVQDWESYDTIFLGYPIWWYELPMIVQGFVNDHDWAGKTVVPFNSHEGSGDSGTYDDLRGMTGTDVLEGIAIRGDSVTGSLDRIDDWYAGLNL